MKKILLFFAVLILCFFGVRGQNNCASPTSLTSILHLPNWHNVQLNWVAPVDSTQQTVQWSTTYATRIGMNAAADFTGVVRFDTADLGSHSGRALTAVSFVPGEAQTTVCNYYIRVWVGGSYANSTFTPGNLILNQAVTSPLTVGVVNTISLDSIINIDPTQEMWIGIRCVTTAGYPLGASSNGVVANKGELMFLGDTTWETLTQSSLTQYNWCIVGTLTESSHVISGYDVSRDNVSLTPTLIHTTAYLDSVTNGTYTYNITAHYANNCVSNPITTIINMHDNPCLTCLDSVTVGTGTTGSYILPINTFYNYSYSQQIYDATEVNAIGGVVSCMAYQYIYTSPQTKGPLKIYIGNTTKSTFSNSSDWVSINDMNLVFDGNVNFDVTNNGGWVKIPFDNSFEWDGTSNIVVALLNGSGSYSSSTNATFNTHSATSKSLYVYNDGSAYSPATATYSGTVGSVRNNIRFFVGEPPICPMPTHFAVTDVTSDGAVAHWQPRGTASSGYEVAAVPAGSTIYNVTPITTTDTFYTFSNLTPNTSYNIYMRSNCSSDNSSWQIRAIHTSCIPVNTLPYVENFDNAGTGTGAFPDCWYKLTNNGSYPYLSNSYAASGNTSMYFYSYTNAYAYAILPPMDQTVTMSNLQVNFKALKPYDAYGHLEVGVMTDPTDLTTFTLIKSLDGTMYPTTNTWYDFVAYLNHYTGTGRYIAFRSPSDYDTYTFLDNVVVNVISGCGTPTNLTVSNVSGSSAYLSWHVSDLSDGTETYTIEYSPVGQGNWQQITTTNLHTMLPGLSQQTTYEIRLFVSCTNGYSDTLTTTLTTNCLAGGIVQIGTGTSTSNLLPTNGCYNYSLTQQLFLSSELNGQNTLNGISFNLITPASNNTRNITIYLGNTTQTSLTSSTYIPSTSQMQVYSGTFTFQSGWNNIIFDSAFVYTGGNLVLTVDDNTGTYSCSPYFQSHTITGTSLYYYNDGTNQNPASPTSLNASSSRNNVKFLGNCDSSVVCPAPNLIVSNVTNNSVDLTWAPGYQETSWELDYRPLSDSTWTSVGTMTTTSYPLTNLSSATTYQVRLRAICSTSDYSNYVTSSFTTLCDYIDSLPFTESFDSIPVNGYPSCWFRLTNQSSLYPYTSSSYSSSPSHSLYFYNSGSSYYAIGVLPRFDDSILMDSLIIGFKTYFPYTSYFMEVGFMTDPADPSTFTNFQTIHPIAGSTWETTELITRTYAGNGHYIAFRLPVGTYNYAYLDDISISYIPSCPHITNLAVASVDSGDVNLTWTAGSTEAAWEVIVTPYGPVDLDTCTASYPTTNSYTEGGLQPGSHYTAYVRADCDVNNISNWESISFWTSQIPAQLPFDCDFESSNPNWGFVNGACTNQWWIGTATNNGGTHSLYISNNNGVSNAYDVTATTNVWAYRDIYFPTSTYGYQFSFDWKAYGESCCDYIKAYIGIPQEVAAGTTMTAPAGSTLLTANNLNVQTNFTTFSTIIPASQGGGVKRIYFLWHNDSSVGTTPPAAIDNVYIASITCPSPTGTTAANITATSANISWTENGAATSWNLAYKISTDTTWTIIPITANPYALSQLTPNTTYQVRIYADCGNNEYSPASSVITFTTLPTCPAPTNLTCTANTSTTISLNWTAGGSETAWTVSYKDHSAADWTNATSVNVTSNTYTITGVNSSTTYDIRVQANCSSTDNSSWSNIIVVSPGSINMTSGTQTITSCGITIYDNGGILNTYVANFDGTITINPDVAGNRVVVSGTYNTESCCDHLYVYDGTVYSDTLLHTYSGTGTIADTSSTGPLTIHFVADVSIQYDGFAIQVSCIAGAPVTCPTPTGLSSTPGSTSAVLSWTGTGNFEVSYKTTASSAWSANTAVTGSTTTITGLTAATAYDWRVRQVCDTSTTSDWATGSFTTNAEVSCPMPTNLHVIDSTNTTATLAWDQVAGTASSWILNYRIANGTWTTTTVSSTSYTIVNLIANTTYQAQVQAICDATNSSDFTPIISFTTTNVGINDYILANSISLYPNPTSNYIDVRVNNTNIKVSEMRVYDVYGKLLQTIVVNGNPTRIDVSKLAEGMYFVRVISDKGIANKSFIKK